MKSATQIKTYSSPLLAGIKRRFKATRLLSHCLKVDEVVVVGGKNFQTEVSPQFKCTEDFW